MPDYMPAAQWRQHVFERVLAMARDPEQRDCARALCDQFEADNEYGWYDGLAERVRAALNNRDVPP